MGEKMEGEMFLNWPTTVQRYNTGPGSCGAAGSPRRGVVTITKKTRGNCKAMKLVWGMMRGDAEKDFMGVKVGGKPCFPKKKKKHGPMARAERKKKRTFRKPYAERLGVRAPQGGDAEAPGKLEKGLKKKAQGLKKERGMSIPFARVQNVFCSKWRGDEIGSKRQRRSYRGPRGKKKKTKFGGR